jgi:hypothetical protein
LTIAKVPAWSRRQSVAPSFAAGRLEEHQYIRADFVREILSTFLGQLSAEAAHCPADDCQNEVQSALEIVDEKHQVDMFSGALFHCRKGGLDGAGRDGRVVLVALLSTAIDMSQVESQN